MPQPIVSSPILTPSSGESYEALLARYQEQRIELEKLRSASSPESPTRSFIVSIFFSAYIVLATVLNLGITMGQFHTPSQAMAWLSAQWFPTLVSLIANPAPFYRFQQSLTRIRQEN